MADHPQNLAVGISALVQRALQRTNAGAGEARKAIDIDLTIHQAQGDEFLDHVQRVARRYLDPTRLTVVVVGDLATIRPGIEKLGLGPVEVQEY